jgi:PadR family transcriptional regulator, regulatory protein PadR
MGMNKVDMLQGTLDMLILKTLNQEPMHGFAIAQRIRQVTDEVIRVGEGSLYPALSRMEKRGWINSTWGLSENNRKAKYYRLTKAGRKQLEGEAVSWARLAEAIAKVMQTA